MPNTNCHQLIKLRSELLSQLSPPKCEQEPFLSRGSRGRSLRVNLSLSISRKHSQATRIPLPKLRREVNPPPVLVQRSGRSKPGHLVPPQTPPSPMRQTEWTFL